VEIDLYYYFGLALIVCLASMIQSLVGFAYALFATPLLLWIGMPLPNAIVIVATCSFIQASFGVKHLSASIPWKLSWMATFVRSVTLMIGLLILLKVSGSDPLEIKFMIGTVLCILVFVQMVFKIHSKEKVHWGWAALSFSASGTLAGICGMGGPPLILWAMAHDWSTEKVRGFLFSVFMVSIPIHLLMMVMTFGDEILWSIGLAFLLTPIVFLGAKIGLPLGNKLPKLVMRRLVNILLLLIGLSSMIPYLLK